MVFANLLFIYLFLPLNLILYFVSRNLIWRNLVLVAFSFVFYAWGEPVWVLLLLTSAILDYLHGRIIETYHGKWQAKLSLILSLTVNLGLLCLFKYSGFLVQNINALLHTSFTVPSFTLPIGISFYTFQTISYVIDVYRKQAQAQKNPLCYLLYLSLYPQLVAGPIVRYVDVAREINHRTTTLPAFSEGFTRFVFGLSKKVLVANVAGQLASGLMDKDFTSLTVGGAWLGAIFFSLQIYYDFSGYSDMAIGLGRMFGFTYKENFHYPYIAQSATEFWRRWHISLSSFFRDYVYIPLGGNRSHPLRNLFIVWLLTGLWHGASWNFILWGLYYGLFIAVERLFLGKWLESAPRFLRHLYLLLLVVIGWVIFYFTDIGRLGGYLSVMFGVNEARLWDIRTGFLLMGNLFWLLLALVFCMPIVKGIKQLAGELSGKQLSISLVLQAFLNLGLLLLCTAQLVGQSYNPFLYYRF